MIIFSGTSNIPLASKIAKKLKVQLGNVEIKRFPDGECRVWVSAKQNISKNEVYVIQSLSYIADQNLMEMCLMGSALKRLGAKKITAVIPWMGYSKQDKEFRKGEAVSAELVAKFIESAGFDKVITVELHSEKIREYFKIPVVELSAKSLLVNELRVTSYGLKNDVIVVSPDKGGKGRSGEFAEMAGLPIAYLDKSRDLVTGKVTIHGIDKNINGKTAIIYDDIINTGSTAVETAKFLHAKGAKKIIFIGIHAVLSGEASKNIEESYIDEVVVTDTINIRDEKKFSKLKIVSVDGLINQKINFK